MGCLSTQLSSWEKLSIVFLPKGFPLSFTVNEYYVYVYYVYDVWCILCIFYVKKSKNVRMIYGLLRK